MPSRASTGAPGGFSYYEHVVLPESEKTLVWEMDGRRYRSQLVEALCTGIKRYFAKNPPLARQRPL
mgnify:CR=1 FL=1